MILLLEESVEVDLIDYLRDLIRGGVGVGRGGKFDQCFDGVDRFFDRGD